MKILADIVSIKVFVNGGELNMLHLVPPPTNVIPLKLTASGAATFAVPRRAVHEVKSIWPRATK